jgi:hypothetical protein
MNRSKLCQQYDIDPDVLGLYIKYRYPTDYKDIPFGFDIVKECLDRYVGTYTCKEQYEESLAEENGLIDKYGFINNLPELFRCYCSVDWEKMALADTDTVALSNGKGKVYIFNISFREE